MNLTDRIRIAQKLCGLSAEDQDGIAGPQTWNAIITKLNGASALDVKESATNPLPTGDLVDARSEGVIATLNAAVRPCARALVHAAAAQGITVRLISGTRTCEEQNALYAQGRTQPGHIVTNCRCGQSNHNFGIAFDIGIFDGTTYVPESARYKAVGALGRTLGLTWGGNWKSIDDEPHFELRPDWARSMSESEMISHLRSMCGISLAAASPTRI